MARKASLKKQAAEILAKAEKQGLQTNFFFATTFHRYMTQMKIMEDLEKEIKATGATVSKEYVKGRANVYTNPAIAEYNKTASAANSTVSTLISILKTLAPEERDENTEDPMSVLLTEIND